MPQADRRRQVPSARRRGPLRHLLRQVPQPAVPRLRGSHHRPCNPSSGRVVARASLRMRGMQEGARRRWLHGAGGSSVLRVVLRGQVRGAVRGLRRAHRGQGHRRARRQVASRLLHLHQMPKSSNGFHVLGARQQAPVRQMRLKSRMTSQPPIEQRHTFVPASTVIFILVRDFQFVPNIVKN